MTERHHHRKRPTKSCMLCRQRKLKCDRKLPCGNCQRSRSGHCQYGNASPGLEHDVRSDNSSRALNTPISLTSEDLASQTRPSSIIALSATTENRADAHADTSYRSCPSASERQTAPTDVDMETTSCELAGTWHVYSGGLQHEGQHAKVARGLVHKTRLLGPSHWATSGVTLGLEAYKKAEQHADPITMRAAIERLQKCKALGRTIKARRAPA